MSDDLCPTTVTYQPPKALGPAAVVQTTQNDGRHPSHQGVEAVPLPTSFVFQVSIVVSFVVLSTRQQSRPRTQHQGQSSKDTIRKARTEGPPCANRSAGSPFIAGCLRSLFGPGRFQVPRHEESGAWLRLRVVEERAVKVRPLAVKGSFMRSLAVKGS